MRYFGCATHPGRDGGTGRRSGLKTRRLYSHGGSIPPPGTTLTLANPMDCAVLIPPFRFAPFLPLEGWCMLGVVTPATSCDFRICDSDSDPDNCRLLVFRREVR